MKRRYKLTLDVTVDVEDEDRQTILSNLEYIPELAMGEGLVTRSADQATVVDWSVRVKEQRLADKEKSKDRHQRKRVKRNKKKIS